MQEPAVIETEAKVREVAKVLMRQLQTVKFMDKKIDAVGTALVSSNDLLTHLKLADDDRTKLIEAVSRTQNSLYQNVSLLGADWSHLNDLSESNDEKLSTIQTSLSSINDSSNQSLSEFNDLVNQNEQYSQQLIDVMSEKLDTINTSMQDISQAEMLSVIVSLTKSLTAMVNEEREQRKAQNEITNKRLNSLVEYVQVLNGAVLKYESTLKRIDARVKAIKIMVDNVDERVSELSPKEYDMSEQSIIEMFSKNGEQDEKSDADVQIENVTDNDTVEQIVDESSTVSDTESKESVAKKPRWKFWK